MQTQLLAPRRILALVAALCSFHTLPTAHGQSWVELTEVPDYEWYAGCFGTATGNLAGYWDRHGFPDFYTGPAGGGLAPLNSGPENQTNENIRSLWASRAGFDGRSKNMPGHVDDYYVGYESTAQDWYKTFNRPEHTPDCTGDFIGLNQKKWTNLNNECRGNIDGFSFVFWDKTGNRRANFYTTNAGAYIPDIGSGLREWARYRGYEADVFTQLTSFNPERTTTNGFTFENVKAEINAGFPVLLFLQTTNEFSRNLASTTNLHENPEIHGILVYGYIEDPTGGSCRQCVFVRNSWGFEASPQPWNNLYDWLGINYSVTSTFAPRGAIGFHPKPKVRRFTRGPGTVTLTWDGPSAQLHDKITGTFSNPHRYTVQRTTFLKPPNWTDVGSITTARTATVPETGTESAFYRVCLLPNP